MKIHKYVFPRYRRLLSVLVVGPLAELEVPDFICLYFQS